MTNENYVVRYSFFLRLHRIPREFPQFSMFREIPQHSRLVDALTKLTGSSQVEMPTRTETVVSINQQSTETAVKE